MRLFDQDGRPIRLGYLWCDEVGPDPAGPEMYRSYGDPASRRTYPYCPEGAPFRFTGPPPTPARTSAPTASASAGAAPTPSASGQGGATTPEFRNVG